jgi:hypothetical protein
LILLAVVFIWSWAHTDSFHGGCHEINAEAFKDRFCHEGMLDDVA